MTITFDPAAYKDTTRAQWEEAADAWHRWGPTLEDWLGRGHRADARRGRRHRRAPACSTSPPAPAGRRSPPRGGSGPPATCSPPTSPPRSWSTRPRRPPTRASRNVSTRELDGERLDVEAGAFDAVISRVGLIYFPDQQAALRGMHAALRPGGRLAGSRLLDRRPQRLLLRPGRHHPAARAAARRRCPASRGRSASAARASPRTRSRPPGSATSRVDVVESPVRMPCAADCVRFERESFGALHQMLAGLSEDRARGGLGGDRRGARAVRGARRLRRPVRDARGDRDEVARAGGAGGTTCVVHPERLLRV